MGKKLSIFISIGEASLKEFHISSSQFRYVCMASGLVALLFCAFLLDYLFSFSSHRNYQKYQAENQQLRSQLVSMRTSMEQLDTRLSQITDFSQKIKVITGVEQADVSFLAVGPLTHSSFPDVSAMLPSRPAKYTPKNSVQKRQTASSHSSVLPPLSGDSLQIYMDRLDRKSQLVHQDITSLMGQVYERKDIIAATPSIIPAKGWVSSRFGYRQYPFTGEVSLHEGMDIASMPGTPVYSPANGVVMFAGYKEGYGKVIVIDHGYELSTLYGHLSDITVLKGQRVDRKAVIGAIGSTGNSSGPHLHYEVRISNVPVDPSNYILNTM